VGIDVYVHSTFLLLIALLALSDLVAGRSALMMARSTILIVAVFAMVVLHEFGHALMARRFGIRTQDITLLPIGGVARLERFPEDPTQQLLVSLAGPATNLAVALGLFGMSLTMGLDTGLDSSFQGGGGFLAQRRGRRTPAGYPQPPRFVARSGRTRRDAHRQRSDGDGGRDDEPRGGTRRRFGGNATARPPCAHGSRGRARGRIIDDWEGRRIDRATSCHSPRRTLPCSEGGGVRVSLPRGGSASF
jgi:hypothetical protein